MRFFRAIAALTAFLIATPACAVDPQPPQPAKTQLFQLPEGARVS